MEIENKKMWESILRQMKSSVNPTMGEINIVRALRDQGLTWDGKEIVSIEPEHEFHPVKKRCIPEDSTLGKLIDETKGKKPDICDGCNNVKGCIACVDGCNWAHIEEAEKNPKQCPCDECNLYCNGAEPTCPDYQEYLKDTEPEISHKDVSKESDQELTEFEKLVRKYISAFNSVCDYNDGDEHVDFDFDAFCHMMSVELRKQIASEIDVHCMCADFRIAGCSDRGLLYFYSRGIEDTTKAIKGE